MNPIFWISRLRPTPTMLRVTFAATILWYCISRADFIVNPIFDAIERIGKDGIPPAMGIFSIPFWCYRILQFGLLLFLSAAWKSIWTYGFGFKRANWFYISDFYCQLALTGLLIIIALLHVLTVPAAIPIRQFYSDLSIVSTALFNIAALVALIQIARMPGTVHGVKAWFVTTGLCTVILTIFGVTSLGGIAATVFAVVQLILIKRMLKMQRNNSRNAIQE